MKFRGEKRGEGRYFKVLTFFEIRKFRIRLGRAGKKLPSFSELFQRWKNLSDGKITGVYLFIR